MHFAPESTLVIIGLIVGGVLAGQELIKAAQLRSVITDNDRFQTAVYTFRSKYNCLPGDCANATSFFGTNPGCPDSADVSGGTCNGNGNEILDVYTPGTVYEPTRFWQQLGLAGLVAGNFVGYYLPTNLLPDSNGAKVPVSRLPTGAVWWAANGDTAQIFYGQTANMFVLGQLTGEAWGPAMSGLDAYSIDSKIDDGNPNTGKMLALNGYNLSGLVWFASGCVNGPATAYDFTSTTPYCVVTFLWYTGNILQCWSALVRFASEIFHGCPMRLSASVKGSRIRTW